MHEERYGISQEDRTAPEAHGSNNPDRQTEGVEIAKQTAIQKGNECAKKKRQNCQQFTRMELRIAEQLTGTSGRDSHDNCAGPVGKQETRSKPSWNG